MSNPQVSVVIPSYNHEKFVEQTIDSVLNQTFQDFEIIITDDGSSDNTVKKIRKYDDPRIQLYVFKRNKGACEALNNCIRKSKGKYVAYISSDDVWEKNKLEKQLKFIERNQNYSVVFSKAKIINEKNELISDDKHPYFSIFDQQNRTREEWLRYFFFNGNCICHPSILIKKSVYDEIGLYNERLANIPDMEMWIRICMKHEIHIMDQKLIRFRVRDEEANASGNKPETHIRGRFEYKHLLDHYKEIDDLEFFFNIFPQAKKYGKPRQNIIEYFLARMAYDTNIDFRQLWALDTLYDLLKDKEICNILKKEYDFTYPKFFKMTYKADSFKMYKHPSKDYRITQLESDLYQLEYKIHKNRSLKNRSFSIFYPFYILYKNKNHGLKNAFVTIKGYRAIKNKKLLDIGFYLRKNGDIRISGMDPILHYIYHGYKEGRKPNPTFDGDYYLKTYEDVAKSKLNPLVHYSLYGIKEKRNTHSSFKNSLKDTLPGYIKFKKSLKGRNDFLFLINDNNNEIKQHFDDSYKSLFNKEIFVHNFQSNKRFCEENNIDYQFFLVPDKSVVCKEFLPFSIKKVNRNYHSIDYLFPDFAENLYYNCYFKGDSHINFLGGKELTFNILNHLDDSFSRENFNDLIKEQMLITKTKVNGDLTSDENWSYSEDSLKKYLQEDMVHYSNKYIEFVNNTIPRDFQYVGERKTEYIKNQKAFSNLRVLVLRDSSTNFIINFLSLYFKELLSYWDHWQFNKELISWYKPDVIIEIRTERFLENSIEFIVPDPENS